MTEKTNVVDDMYKLCISEENPTFYILKNGTLPDTWADRYFNLLEKASHYWQQQDLWHKKLVTAIHFTSFYLRFRYDAWCAFSGNKNEETEATLARIRVRSEFFLMDFPPPGKDR